MFQFSKFYSLHSTINYETATDSATEMTPSVQLWCELPEAGQRPGRPCILGVRSEGSRWPAYGGGTWSGSCDASSALGTLTSLLCAREALRNIPDDMDSCLRDRPTFRVEVTGTWLLWAPTTP